MKPGAAGRARDFRDRSEARRLPRWSVSRFLLSGLLCLGSAACANSGDALASETQNHWDIEFGRPVALGEEWVFLYWLHNESDSVISLTEVSVRGHPWGASGVGIGSVVEGVRFKVGTTGMPGGIYSTYPPSIRIGKRCRAFEPQHVGGHTMAPGEAAMVLLHLRTIGQGHFETAGITVSYAQDGRRFTELIPLKLSGDISRDGKELEPDEGEAECLPRGGQVLP